MDDATLFQSDLTAMKSDMVDVKNSLQNIATALSKLAILEERQSTHTNLMEKYLTRMERLETAQHATELRFATAMDAQQRLLSVESQVQTIANKILAFEASKETATAGVKIIWALIGSAVGAAIAAGLAVK